MEISRNHVRTTTGSSEWFTGTVLIDSIVTPSGDSRMSVSEVHFAPGARTAWHTHPNGQTIYVTRGVGRAQRRGGDVNVIRSGDRVFFEPGEDHWHGAAADRLMSHLSIIEVDDAGNSGTFGDQVSDEEYGTAGDEGDRGAR
jgi:quercetin dioxygenase-like cupin family protein